MFLVGSVEVRNYHRVLMTRTLVRMANKEMAQGLILLHQNMTASKYAERASAEEEVKLERFAARFRNIGILKVWHSWCEFVNWRQHVRFLVGRVFQRVTNGKVVSGFETWKDFVLERRKLARFVAKLASYSLSNMAVMAIVHGRHARQQNASR